MRRAPVRSLIGLLFACTLNAAALAGVQFLHGIDDLPLMAGLTEVPNATVVFDKPGGRIVEAYATGHGIKASQVLQFYAGTLPQLGWRPLSETEFQRDGERLKLTIIMRDDLLTLRYDIAPR